MTSKTYPKGPSNKSFISLNGAIKKKGNSFRATPFTNSPSLFGTLIHSCYSKTQRPALGHPKWTTWTVAPPSQCYGR
jgi:hypothetical protein